MVTSTASIDPHRVRVNSIGTVRRLQALVALGYSFARLADELCLQVDQVVNLTHDRMPVSWAIAREVRHLYSRLQMKPPAGEDVAVAQARKYARARAWAVPLAWDDIDTDERPYRPSRGADTLIDEVAIERALAGDRDVHLTLHERREVIRRWMNSGRTLRELERRTGWNVYRMKRNVIEQDAA